MRATEAPLTNWRAGVMIVPLTWPAGPALAAAAGGAAPPDGAAGAPSGAPKAAAGRSIDARMRLTAAPPNAPIRLVTGSAYPPARAKGRKESHCRGLPPHLLVSSEHPPVQIRQTIEAFRLKVDPGAFLNRCLICNAATLEIDKEEAREEVPPHLLARHAPDRDARVAGGGGELRSRDGSQPAAFKGKVSAPPRPTK